MHHEERLERPRASTVDNRRHTRPVVRGHHASSLAPLAIPPLPAPRTLLIAREQELATVIAVLQRKANYLVTLTGPGGTGKTRLAVAVAAALQPAFAHGVAFVDLAPLTDTALVVPSIARTLGVLGHGSAPLEERLAALLRPRSLLLVLDNFEHLLEAAPAVAALLQTCPSVKVLATSREPLRIHGEQEMPLPPLPLPRAGASTSREVIAASGAVALFVERAREVQADFALTDENAGVIVAICRRLDGLPLALELAASWLKVLSPQELLVRLRRILPLLTHGARDLPARQQTLRATIAWSYNLLTPAEQALFRRLAVFAGCFTLEAAEAVTTAGGGETLAVLETLASLVDKSLLRREEWPDDQPRFAMLETLREFALEELDASGEMRALRNRHAVWCATLAATAEKGLLSAERAAWVQCLATERYNLWAALDWCVHNQAVDLGTPLISAIVVWQVRDAQLTEGLVVGRSTAEALLALPGASGSTWTRAKLLQCIGMWAYAQHDYPAAVTALEASVAVWRTVAERHSDTRGLAHALVWLAQTLFMCGDSAGARAYGAESIALCRTLGAGWDLAHVLGRLGTAALIAGSAEEARQMLEESRLLYRAAGDRWTLAGILRLLGYLAQAQRDYTGASRLFSESLLLNQEVRDQRAVATCIAALAGAAAAQGEWERAARLLGAATSVLDPAGGPSMISDHHPYEESLTAVRSALGEAVFTAVWAEGEAMSLDAAVAYALTPDHLSGFAVVTSPATPSFSEGSLLDGLSSRELDVLRLLVAGKRNPEIAEALVISRNTVERHVSHILTKIGAANRTEAAAYALRHGLAS